MNSFTDLEHQIAPRLRRQIARAESTEDVKKFFSQAGRDLLRLVFTQEKLSTSDIELAPHERPFFALADRLEALPEVSKVLTQSDLRHVIGRFAEAAVHRFRHLEKHREKTESKIFHRHR